MASFLRFCFALFIVAVLAPLIILAVLEGLEFHFSWETSFMEESYLSLTRCQSSG